MLLSVIIVNYNTGGLLEACLASLEQKFAGIPHQVIVVDNASTDGSQEAARKRPDVTLIAGDRNIGFAAGCNAGVQAAGGDYLLFLNPDTRILSDDIGGLLKRFDGMENAGALGCQNRLPDGSIQTTAYAFPGAMQVFLFVFRLKALLRFGWLKALLAPFLKNRFGQFHPHNEVRTVDWVTGAFLLVKRAAWQKVGYFDQRFFLFCEEIDWCLRLKQAGYDTVFDPSFEIEHHVGASSKKVAPLVLREKYRSYKRYFEKHLSFNQNLLLRIIFYTGPRFWTTVYTLRGNKHNADAYRMVRRALEEDDG